MKNIVSILILVFLVQMNAIANEECTVGEQEAIIKPTKDLKNYNLKSSNNVLEETFDDPKLKNVDITHGGCHHYGLAISFPIDTKELKDIKKKATTSLHHLEAFTEISLKNIIEIINKQEKVILDKLITETEGYSYLIITTRKDANGILKLVISYEVSI